MTETPPIDTTVAHSARVWNYWLGGKDHYPVDRALGDQILAVRPSIVTDARAGRGFLTRGITHLAREEGVRQFLDIGTGLPTANNTHEVAQAAAPGSRVVYVDNDPMVLAHARALLVGTEEGATAFVDTDLRETGKVLAAAGDLLDLDRPVALSVVGTLGHIPDLAEALDVMERYRAALAPGSFVMVGDHVMPDDPAALAALERWNEGAALAYRSHTREEFAAYFGGLDLLEPGVVPATRWRAGEPEVGEAPDTDMWAGLARKP
ncbi:MULTISPECIES: SAM-dependent methyltransferase [unclassified Nocardiopsis]|uniref:SAM-dependent methyltransferase n=1 Tax=unclassified Nocardiopsis TaxID=2649073 RepID=UPI00135AB038|nr:MULTISPECIES: SAM-dependent methyltransferase [unclassified Nocardiopsis]